MYRDLIVNLTIIISCLAITGELYKNRSNPSSRKYHVLAGIIGGFLGIVLMFFSINITDTTIMDLRNFAIIGATLYGGILSGAIAAFICSVGRMLLFGFNISSYTALITFIILAILCGVIYKAEMSAFRKFMTMNIGNVVVVYAAFVYLIKDPIRLSEAVIYYGLISFIGGLVIYHFYDYMVQSNENFRRLRLFEKVIDTTHQGVSIQIKKEILLLSMKDLQELQVTRNRKQSD
ncbi:LytS/YhcK type 5TM receptor domain-containing protein [Cytobacillus sp. FJAT-54145]|uniref:LytS/YhcK type 5TM receptor domain-containing protein n=1 Tax=Cytobacillus spartinae TaxID=3299023 RepID=A0ABW6K679_9BACI